ncbi:MAG: hypothetical protein ACXIUD_18270 [Mongoliitalea sp.]
MNNREPIEDEELRRFFLEWKEKDEQLPIPPVEFKKQATFKLWKWLPIGVAAAGLIGFFLLKPSSVETGLEKDLIIIQLIEHANQEQEIIIETSSSLDVWEAPSSSLLTEF